MPNPEESFTKIDVPADGSCLFWAVTLAYLTPAKNDDDLFQQRYKALFGNEKTVTQNLNHIRNLVQNYNIDDTFAGLVRSTFRSRVVNHIRSHENEFRAFVEGGRSFDDYLQDMENPNTWGGEPEIRAMSEMLSARISVSGATTSQYNNDGNIQIQLFHVGAPGARNHYNFGLEKHIVDNNEVGRLQNSLKESIKHYQIRPQNFELIQLLIQEADSLKASTSTQQREGFESFQARFQSYIDQIPSYLHSVEKPGFFSHFFFGSFSTLLDTEIAGKLNIKKIYFSFDTSKTLKVVVVKNGQIGSVEDAINNIDLFSISEGKRGHQFTFDELEDILKQNLILENEEKLSEKARAIIDEIKSDKTKSMKSRLVQISKEKDGISVNMEAKGILDYGTSKEFHEIKKVLRNKLEDDIAKLTDTKEEKVKQSLKGLLEKISKVHSKYEDSLQYGSKAREAAHHAYLAGIFSNFHYGFNSRVCLEQFAGRGYADIVLLVRGPNRALDSIPIIIELKAGKGPNLTPDKALEQAEKYAQGFQPNVQRVLTTANDILYVGVNLDYPSPISNIETKSREEEMVPLFQDMLESTYKWSEKNIDQETLKTRIQDNIERIYHTFPGTPEKGDNHYFSRFLLGQSLLLSEALGTSFEKHVFIYNKDENIPTEIHPESGRPQRPAARKAKGKLSTGLDASHAVVSMVLIPESTEKLVYVINIAEADRKGVLNKVLPLDRLSQKIGNRKIVELSLDFDTRHKPNSQRYLTIEANKFISPEQYSDGVDGFQGTFREVPYPNELKETFDRALDSQRTSAQSSSIDKYNELFKKIGEGIWPFKTLINNEPHFQGVLNGAFSYYSDLKLQESPETRALVLTEFQTGRGERIDMLVHGIKFEGDAKEYTPIGLELKASRQGKGAQALLKEANDQINKEYKEGVTYKTLTDGDEVKFIGVVFNKGAQDADSLILTSEKSISVKVVHSSTHVLPKVEGLRTLESATAEKDYHYWLQQHDMPDIARVEYGYADGTPFEVVGLPEHIANELQQFQNSVTTRGEERPLTLVVNLNNNHWVTLVIAYQNERYTGYYADSQGNSIPDNIREVLEQAQITIHDVSVAQQTDGHNCGLWALENARDVNAVLRENRSHDIPIDEIHNLLQVGERNEDYFVRMRQGVSTKLNEDQRREDNLRIILAEQQPVGQCSKERKKRNIGMACVDSRDEEDITKEEKEQRIKELFDADKVVEKVKNIEFYDHLLKISQQISQGVIVEESLMTGLKDKIGSLDLNSIDPEMRDIIQEIKENINDGEINKGKIKDILSKPGTTGRLVNAAGRISLIRGIHGTFHALQQGDMVEFGLGIGEMALSPFSQLIEDGVVKFAPKVIKQMKGGVYAARGVGGLISNAFDIVDLVRSSINLSKAKKGSKEWRDAIAGVTFSSASIVLGAATTAFSMPGVGTIVGLVIVTGQGFYSGISMLAELKEYCLNTNEEFRTFFHTFALQPIPQDVEYIVARKNVVDSLADQAREVLHNSSDYTVAYAIGLGSIAVYPRTFVSAGHGVINMTYHSVNPSNFSRFTPDVVYEPNYGSICLPRCPSIDEKYGYDCTLGSPQKRYLGLPGYLIKLYYCENAMITGHSGRARNAIRKNIGGKVIYNLELVNSGRVQGNSKWRNEFIIYDGKVEVYGGNGTVNIFMLMNPEFKGKIFGGNNATNVIDVSNLKRNVRYDSENGTILGIPIEKINYFIGNAEESDRVDCSNSDMVVDSKGAKHDQDYIDNCKQVTIYGNTQVRSRRDGDHKFYVIPSIGHSSIDIKDKGVIIFPETALLNDCDSITYTVDNVLSLEIPLNTSEGKFTLDILNYLDKESVSRFTLIDKHDSVIVPLIDFGKKSNETLQVDSFVLNARTTLDGEEAKRAIEKTTEEIWKEKQRIAKAEERLFIDVARGAETAREELIKAEDIMADEWQKLHRRRDMIWSSAECSQQEKEVVIRAFDNTSVRLEEIKMEKVQALKEVTEACMGKLNAIGKGWQDERENVWNERTGEVGKAWKAEVEREEQVLKTALDKAKGMQEKFVRELGKHYDELMTRVNVTSETERKCLGVVSSIDKSFKEKLKVWYEAYKRESELFDMSEEFYCVREEKKQEEVRAREEAFDDGIERDGFEWFHGEELWLFLAAAKKIKDNIGQMEKALQARSEFQRALRRVEMVIIVEGGMEEVEKSDVEGKSRLVLAAIREMLYAERAEEATIEERSKFQRALYRLEMIIMGEEVRDDGIEEVEGSDVEGRSELALVAVQKVLDAKVEIDKAKQTGKVPIKARLKLQRALYKARMTIMEEEEVLEFEESIDKEMKECLTLLTKEEEEINIEQSYKKYYAMEKDRSALLNWYKSIAKSRDNYKVYSIIKEDDFNTKIPYNILGSTKPEVISLKEVRFAKGGEGGDSYILFAEDIKEDLNFIEIDNKANDKEFDILYIPAIPKDAMVYGCSLLLSGILNNTYIKIKNYFLNDEYRHLVLTPFSDKKEMFVVPSTQGERSCNEIVKGTWGESDIQTVQLIPFYHATGRRNFYSVSKEQVGSYQAIAIDAYLNNTLFYHDHDDFILIATHNNRFLGVRLLGFSHERSTDLYFYPDNYQLNLEEVYQRAKKLEQDYLHSLRIDGWFSIDNAGDNFSSFRYYRPDEQGLQIYHNQPNNENKVGFTDLKDKSILDFDVRIVDNSLILSCGNDTVVKIENWNTYRPAREMMFVFNDTMISNEKCIISNCNPEDIIKEFKKEKEEKEKPVQRKRRHHHGDNDRHHSSHKPLAIDLSNQPEIAARQDVPENSLQNDETGYNKGGATSGASKPSSWIESIVNWIKGSTESPALLTSREHDNITVTSVPEINATLVNNTIILGILAAGLFNKTQHKQPIHENLLSPREQSMRLNNIDEDMIRAMQESEELGDPNTDMDEVEISGNKTGMWKGGK